MPQGHGGKTPPPGPAWAVDPPHAAAHAKAGRAPFGALPRPAFLASGEGVCERLLEDREALVEVVRRRHQGHEHPDRVPVEP